MSLGIVILKLCLAFYPSRCIDSEIPVELVQMQNPPVGSEVSLRYIGKLKNGKGAGKYSDGYLVTAVIENRGKQKFCVLRHGFSFKNELGESINYELMPEVVPIDRAEFVSIYPSEKWEVDLILQARPKANKIIFEGLSQCPS